MTTTFQDNCDTVSEEIFARLNGTATGKWHDPHNNGKYSLISADGQTTVQIKTKRLTGDGKYTDLQQFTLVPYGSGCNMIACSQSQVQSVIDKST